MLMKFYKKTVLSFLALVSLLAISTQNTYANPQLTNLDLSQTELILKNLGAALVYRNAEAPVPYTSLLGFGVHLGLAVNATSSKDIKDTVEKVSSGSVNTSQFPPVIPTGSIIIGVSAPFGLGADVGFIPNINAGSASLSNIGATLRWTFSELPVIQALNLFDMAVRVGGTTSKFSFEQEVNPGVKDKVTYKTSVLTGQIVAAKSLGGILIPYLGLGIAKQTASLGNTVNGQLFNTSVTQTDSFSKQYSSFWLNAGFEVKLAILSLGFEFNRMFDTNSGSFRLGFKFP
jgi:hypothetical protein